MESKQNIQIIGAGLCGSLLALRLGQRGFKVNVYESRPDSRKSNFNSGRSINLALSNRGLKALHLAGLKETVMPLCIPMHGRMLHDIEGHTQLAPYSGRNQEYIYSISRSDLNTLLLNEADKHPNVNLHFNHKCTHVDFENNKAYYTNTDSKTEIIAHSDVIFGCDGAGSELRKSYFLEHKFLFSFSQNFLNHGYKELSILPHADNTYKTFKNALHIWGRNDFMLIALPNLDGSFTVTLFLSYNEGDYNFNNLTTPNKVEHFFNTYFKDALSLMPNLVDDFFKNPTSPLGTVKCSPWHYKGNTLLLGDAAHAIVPFYGQGMNAAFEDVFELDKLLDKNYNQWELLFKDFESNRKKNTDAIADLAIDNFHEMKGHVNHNLFREKRSLEMALEQHFPETYYSKYALVTFNELVGYQDAMIKGRAQDKALLNLLDKGLINLPIPQEKQELKKILDLVITETEALLKEDLIVKNL